MTRPALHLISTRLLRTGSSPGDLFVLLHTPSVQTLSTGSIETIRSILENEALLPGFLNSVQAERHRAWRRLTTATARRDWSVWLKDYWTCVAPATELVTTMREAEKHSDKKHVGLLASGMPLLYGATYLFQRARDIGVDHGGHVVLSARDLSEAAEVAAWAARREALLPREELKRLRPTASLPARRDDYWSDHQGMWWLGGSG